MSYILSMDYKDEEGRWQQSVIEFNTEQEAANFGSKQYLLGKCQYYEVYHS